MALLYLTGQEEENSELDLLLKDNLASMGDAITSNPGSLAWCEAYAIAMCQISALDFIRLLSYQLTPSQMSVFARRFADIYGLNTTGNKPIPDNLPELQTQIELRQALFGTPNTFTNIYQYVKSVLGQIFIDLEFNYNIQNLASGNVPLPPTDFWFSPLSLLYVREWQPRDNQDNLLMPTPVFLTTKDSYKRFLQEWLPSYSAPINKQLMYTGNNTISPQYGTSNTISAVFNANTITGGGGCAFTKDLAGVNLNGWQMPIEVVADDNNVYTYTVTHVTDDNHLTIKENIKAAITARSYRLLGIQMDVPYALDRQLFNI